MSTLAARTRVLLLVEDNPGDAHLVTEMLQEPGRDGWQIVEVPSLARAVEALRQTEVDVVLLDLSLPDGAGVDSVRAVREAASRVPIVVLTGSNDEDLAMACIDAGAQDYLFKAEARPRELRRAVGYAITRIREAQLRELQEVLDRYRALSSQTQGTTVTAALARTGAINLRNPETFEAIVQGYSTVLEPLVLYRGEPVGAPRPTMERVVRMLGDLNGGPRDLLDVHIEALNRAMALQDQAFARALMFEARLLALQMMGMLVDYYRVGFRRWPAEERAP